MADEAKGKELSVGQNARLGAFVGRISWIGKEIEADEAKKIQHQPAEARLVYLETVHAQTPGGMIHGFDGAHFQVKSLKCLFKDLKAV